MTESLQSALDSSDAVSDLIQTLEAGDLDHAVNLRGLDLSDDAFEKIGQELFVAIGSSDKVEVRSDVSFSTGSLLSPGVGPWEQPSRQDRWLPSRASCPVPEDALDPQTRKQWLERHALRQHSPCIGRERELEAERAVPGHERGWCHNRLQ